MYTKESLIRYKKDTNEYLSFSYVGGKFRRYRFPINNAENITEETAYLNAMATQTFLSLENTMKLLRPQLKIIKGKKTTNVAIRYLNNNNRMKTVIVSKKNAAVYFENKTIPTLDLKVMYAEKWISEYADSLYHKLVHGEKCRWNIEYE